MKLSTFLSFNGQAEEAFSFYASLFQTDIRGIFRVSDLPDAAAFSEEKQRLITWITMDVYNLTLQGADAGLFNDVVITADHQPNQWLVLSPDSREEADRLFSALAQDGKIVMPLADQFFGAYYGRLIDRFGIGWDMMYMTGMPNGVQ